MDTVIDPSNNCHQQQLLNEIDKERIPVFETLISFGSMRVSVDDSSAEQSVNRRHIAISELASVLIDFESKRELVYTNNQTLSTPPITAEEEEKQGSSKRRRRRTTEIVQIGKIVVDVLTNLHNLASDAFLSPKPLCEFGIRHWGVTFLCEILIRLERRRNIQELEEERLRLFIIQFDVGYEEDLSDRLVLLDKEIDECKNNFYETDPILFLVDHREIVEADRKRQIAVVNYSSEELRLQRKRELVVGTKTSEDQVKRRLQEFMMMNNDCSRITDVDLSNMLAQIEKRRACALEAFRAPISHPTQIMTLSRDLLKLERKQDALVLGDSPEQAYDVISMRGSDFYEKSVDVEKMFNEELPSDDDDILDRIARGDDSDYYF